MRILITGGAGFVGHHFVEHFIRNTDHELIVWDKLTYASTWARLQDIGATENKRAKCLSVDFAKPIPDGIKKETGKVHYILHLGAESHVDRSIDDPKPFIVSNVLGTHHMLQFAKEVDAHFCYFGTDEVFGPAPQGVNYKEGDRHFPANPYAATKSGAEMLVLAYANTYGIQCMITRCMNLFGERQHPEKFIPLLIRKVQAGESVTIHADRERKNAGSRFYIHARNCADAYLHLLEKLGVGDVWHIVGEREVNNLALAEMVAQILGKPLNYELVDFHSSRPGHDLRYALDGSKLSEAGWTVPKTFEQSLQKTVEWFLARPEWLR